jgi:NAD(P)-dependent dehydrogenase (short-subunit alcohol dehydrogenase family)
MGVKAIVTGHSRGLGAAIVDTLLARAIPVLGLARHCHPSSDPRLSQHMLDLANPQALAEWLASSSLGDFLADASQALLINNAGQVQPIAPVGQQSAAEIIQAVNLNVTAPLLLSNAFVAASPHCADRRLLHVSSGAARHAYPGWSVYCASKSALDRHAQALAEENQPGVRVVSLAPGVVDTDMQADIRASALEDFPLRRRFDALKAEGRLSSPHATAWQLVDALLHPGFGEVVLADVRQH